jgi:beta-glucosidase/6-phospho-beta-glucosidase/beta-galactosidase
MKTITKTYETMNFDGNYETVTAEFVKTKQLLKTAKQTDYMLVYRKAVDWKQPNYYVIDGIVWCEDTNWINTRLVGCGECRNMGSAKEFETDTVLCNYFKNSI